MTLPALLTAQGVRVRHDTSRRYTPQDITFEVHPGEVVLILGPSGSGKSTLALTLNGLIPHAVPAELDGSVKLAGLETRDHPVGRLSEHVAMVFQDPDAQIVTGTLLDEVCFGPENQLLPPDVVLERAEVALRHVGLWERRGENPDRLSGGGRQRLAIACALAMGSPLLVLDEPTANLDAAGIDEVYSVLRELAAADARAIVLIEHNLDQVIDLVDRVIVLDRDGRLVADGPAHTLLRERAHELLELGVWLPVSTLAALRLIESGIPLQPLPLTPRELTEALDRVDNLPPPSGTGLPSEDRDPVGEPAGSKPNPAAASSPDLALPAITVHELSLRRGGKRSPLVLEDVSLQIERGDFLAIVGTNGAGKTSLLQAIAGVLTPPRGQIDVLGLDPGRIDGRTLARHIGFVFQNPEHQFITHTVADELEHGLRVHGVPETERRERVNEILHRFGLTELRDHHPFLLSGGQKRRLSVGTALIAGAPLLALDEPTFGQDRERAAELLDILSALNRNGTTVIVVTHDLQLVADYATHVAVMCEGRLIGTGTTEDILASALIDEAGLRPPALARAMRALTRHPQWRSITRMDQLPGTAVRPATSGLFSTVSPVGGTS